MQTVGDDCVLRHKCSQYIRHAWGSGQIKQRHVPGAFHRSSTVVEFECQVLAHVNFLEILI